MKLSKDLEKIIDDNCYVVMRCLNLRTHTSRESAREMIVNFEKYIDGMEVQGFDIARYREYITGFMIAYETKYKEEYKR